MPEDNQSQILEKTFVCDNKNDYENCKLKGESHSHENISKVSSSNELQSNNNETFVLIFFYFYFCFVCYGDGFCCL